MSAENWFLRSPSFTLDRLGAIPSPPLPHARAAYSLAVYFFRDLQMRLLAGLGPRPNSFTR
jgi:hypothetical protein